MKLIIAGGRDYRLTATDILFLNTIPNVTEVVSGGAQGADLDGEQWAETKQIPVKRFPAKWHLHGKAAGMIRNRFMAEYADAAALFPGGRGTANMRSEARKLGLVIFDRMFTKERN